MSEFRVIVLDDNENNLNETVEAMSRPPWAKNALHANRLVIEPYSTAAEAEAAYFVHDSNDRVRGAEALVVDVHLPWETEPSQPGKDQEGGYKFIQRLNMRAADQRGVAHPYNIIFYSGNPQTNQPLRGTWARSFVTFLRRGEQEAPLQCALQHAFDHWNRVRERHAIISDADRELYFDVIPMIARNPSHSLIMGPTGTGKDLVAQTLAEEMAFHRTARSGHHVVNCGALSEHLLLSDLIGHEVGAFTGAARNRLGEMLMASGYKLGPPAKESKQLHRALDPTSVLGGAAAIAEHGDALEPLSPSDPMPGVLVLDELAHLHMSGQQALLRAVENQAVFPLGYSGRGLRPNVIVIGITNKELDLAAKDGRFLPDLLARLRGWQVSLKPLRERPETARSIAVQRTREQVVWDRDAASQARWARDPARQMPYRMRLSGDGDGVTGSESALEVLVDALPVLDGNARDVRNLVDRAGAIRREIPSKQRPDHELVITGDDMRDAIEMFRNPNAAAKRISDDPIAQRIRDGLRCAFKEANIELPITRKKHAYNWKRLMKASKAKPVIASIVLWARWEAKQSEIAAKAFCEFIEDPHDPIRAANWERKISLFLSKPGIKVSIPSEKPADPDLTRVDGSQSREKN